jgi:hypothetical protein
MSLTVLILYIWSKYKSTLYLRLNCEYTSVFRVIRRMKNSYFPRKHQRNIYFPNGATLRFLCSGK